MLGLHTTYFILMTLLGVKSKSNLFDVQCEYSKDVQCGKDVTVTCNLNYPYSEATLLEDDKPKVNISLLKGNCSEDNISIGIFEDKMKLIMTIHNIKFSRAPKYVLWFNSLNNGFRSERLQIGVIGVCNPVLANGNDELRCKSETTKLDPGFKMITSLNSTNDNRKLEMCCSVVDEKGENKTYIPQSGESRGDEKKVANYIIFPLVAILAFVCLLLALRHRHSRPIGSPEQREFSIISRRVYQGFRQLKERVIPQVVSVEDLQEKNQGQSHEICIELISEIPTKHE